MEFCREQVKSDCEELLTRFHKTESVRFEVFSRIWKEMNFSTIFFGPMESYEQRAFCHEIICTATTFFLPPFSFQIRVGGLYLLYGLYHHQFSIPREKIRLSLNHWDDVKKFEQDAINAQHFDAVYILRTLLEHKAFHFTAMPRMLCYNMKREMKKEEMCEDFMERACRPQEVVTKDLLEELSNVHEHYQQLKAGAAVTANQPDPSINLIQRDFVTQLRQTVVGFYNWQQEKDVPPGDDEEEEDSGEGTSTQQESSKRAELLASIKSKSYGQAVEASLSRRHRQVELELTSFESGPSDERRGRQKKFSLKERTLMNVELKGNMKKESMKVTKLWDLSKPETEPEELPKKKLKFNW